MLNKLKKLQAFTLIELLVVIVIIGILAGLVLAASSSVMYKARATDAASYINQIRVALTSYQNDYGDWPPPLLTNTNTYPSTGDAYLIASTNPATTNYVWTSLYNTLTATGATTNLASNNSRHIVYMQIPTKYLNNTTNPTNSVTFFDPWKNEYNLAADVNGDNTIANLPQTTGTTVPNTSLTINASLAIWSYGGTPSNTSKYVISWK
ncbi:MAG: type II secretion system protein [Chthoniobacteraceae bacterium]